MENVGILRGLAPSLPSCNAGHVTDRNHLIFLLDRDGFNLLVSQEFSLPSLLP